MKLHLTPREPSWWLWLAAELLMLAGLLVAPLFIQAAIILAAGQGIVYLLKDRTFSSSRAQTRLAFALLLWLLSRIGVAWPFWVPVLGTVARLLFSYCTMGRILSLLPWNRRDAISPSLLRRTFLAPSEVDDAIFLTAAPWRTKNKLAPRNHNSFVPPS